MMKSYKVMFNKQVIQVEDNALNNAKVIQNIKTTSTRPYTMYLIAKDVYECLKIAKVHYADHFNNDKPKSIEVERLISEPTKRVKFDQNMMNLVNAIKCA